MEEIIRYRKLLIVVAVLLLVKFIFVPIVELQNNLIEENQLLNKRVNSIEGLLNRDDSIFTESLIAKTNLAIAKDAFFIEQNESKFRLEQQKLLERVFQGNDITLQNFGWQVKTKVVGIEVWQHRVELNISAQLHKMVKLFSILESHKPIIEIDSFNFRVQGQNSESLGRVSGRLILNLYSSLEFEGNAAIEPAIASGKE